MYFILGFITGLFAYINVYFWGKIYREKKTNKPTKQR